MSSTAGKFRRTVIHPPPTISTGTTGTDGRASFLAQPWDWRLLQENNPRRTL
jgi:hypothetical protein